MKLLGDFYFVYTNLHTRHFLSLRTVLRSFKYIKCIHWRQRRIIMIPYRVEKDWCSKYVRKNCKTCLFRRLFILIEINVLTWPSPFVKGLKMLYSVTEDTQRLFGYVIYSYIIFFTTDTSIPNAKRAMCEKCYSFIYVMT